MKNVLFLYAITMLVATISFAQQGKQSLSDSLREAGKLQEAIAEYAKIYKSDSENTTNTYNYACALALDWQIDSAFHYLNIATEKDTSVRPLTDPDFIFLIEDPRWTTFEDRQVEKVEAKFGQYEILELSKELWNMRLKDQAYYYHIQVAEKQLGYGSPVTRALWKLKEKINDENVKRLEEIIAEHGYPKESVVKGSAAGAAFLIIQHADIEIQKEYLPMMKEAADSGEASWSQLALLIDRVNLREGMEQVYGSQIYRNEDGTFYVKDLKDPEYVNQRRKEVGLGPIQDYVSRWGIEWTIEQKEK